MSLSKSVLDSMMQGGDSTPENWEALLKSPDREALWFDAVKRREGLNAYIRFVAAYPDIATRIRSFKKYLGKVSETAKELVVNIPQPFDLLSPELGRKEDKGADLSSLLVKWGSDQVAELHDKTEIEFKLSQASSCYYEYKTEEGWLESPYYWEVLIEDGPVTLVFFDQKLSDLPLEVALAKASSKAILVIVPEKRN